LPSDNIKLHGLADLHAGECQCLYLCQQLPVSLILTDDLAVRDASTRLGFTPVGSLGIVVRAYRQTLITLADAEHAINQLYDVSSLFVTRAIVDVAIEQLRQHILLIFDKHRKREERPPRATPRSLRRATGNLSAYPLYALLITLYRATLLSQTIHGGI
jgi:hypothetical protein